MRRKPLESLKTDSGMAVEGAPPRAGGAADVACGGARASGEQPAWLVGGLGVTERQKRTANALKRRAGAELQALLADPR